MVAGLWCYSASICRTTMIIGICGLVLMGCSKKNSDQATTSTGQVVAHVGDQDVTTQELEHELRLANVPVDKQKDPAIIKQALEELVLRKYLLEQALSAKLDRDPSVLLEILRARTQVLANAYVTRSISAKPISKEDIEKFIANNPSKFANRQLFSVEQITVPIGTNLQTVTDATKDSKSLDEVDQKLTTLGVPHGRSTDFLNSGEISQEMLNLIQAKKADDVFFVRSGANGVFFKVLGQDKRPLEGEAADNLARRLLKADQLKAEIGMASVAANLEAKYEGEYAKVMSNQK
jgi:EpsD family peptidyl-prolyl cis-trans isomerase